MTLPRSDSVWALYALTNSMMLTPCWPSAGPTGGAGVAAPALICNLMIAESFRFLGGISSFLLDLNLGDLAERQLDWGLAAEDGHQHLELLCVHVDLVDRGRERGDRAVHDGDRLADLEVDLDGRLAARTRGDVGGLPARGGLLGLDARQEELDDVVVGQRRRLRRGAHEAGDARRVADGAPRLVVEVHPHQDVAGQHLALHLLALAVLDLGDLFGGHLELEDVVLDVEGLHAGLE